MTFLGFALHVNKDISYSILEDDLPKIKPRYYSIVNDPFFDNDTRKIIDKGKLLKICFTLHRFPLK